MEQFNLFEEIERKAYDDERFAEIRKQYKLWKTIPDGSYTPYKPEFDKLHYAYEYSPNHLCEDKPDNESIWWNKGASIGGDEYWVWSRPVICGKQIQTCPYCGANLAKGEGARFSLKWARGYTFWQEKTVRKYYKLDEVDAEERSA